MKAKSRFSPMIRATMVACVVCLMLSSVSFGAETVTFAKDVAPILQAKCQECHHSGSMAPMSLVTRLMTHLPLLPFVGGVSYELIRISARHSSTLIGRIIVAPGLWLQKITTKEPDDGQLEVALTALRTALGHEETASSPRQTAAALG